MQTINLIKYTQPQPTLIKSQHAHDRISTTNIGYLGGTRRNNKSFILGFIHDDQAEYIRDKIQTDAFLLRQDNVNDTHYILTLKKFSSPKKPINKRTLKVSQDKLLDAIFFTSIHNLDLVLIDNIHEDTPNSIRLLNSHSIDVELDQSIFIQQLNERFTTGKFDHKKAIASLITESNLLDEGDLTI